MAGDRQLPVPGPHRRRGLHQHQTLAEVAVRHDVDDEVDGRVEDDEEVADRRVVVVPVTARARLLVDERPQDVVDEMSPVGSSLRYCPPVLMGVHAKRNVEVIF